MSTTTHKFLRDDRGVRYFFIALALIIVSGGVALAIIRPFDTPFSGVSVTPKPPEPRKYYSPLTGMQVKNEKMTTQQVTAIMIENSPDARPQSGLKDAGVVFEAIAEGGITRFAALYQEKKPSLIGPVRSVRPYYLEWIRPFDPAIAHIGGSANALREVRTRHYKDIDQFFNANTYWRATDRAAPHNVYTNFTKLDALNSSKGYKQSKFTGFARQSVKKKKPGAVAPKKLEKATAIDIEVSSAIYSPSYKYDVKTKLYKRFLGDQPHNDREKGQLSPRVVIAIKVPTTIGFEDGYREQMKTSGKGEAYIFQDGVVIKGFWDKPSKFRQMTFTTKDGSVIPLARGQTWITATPTGKNVSWR